MFAIKRNRMRLYAFIIFVLALVWGVSVMVANAQTAVPTFNVTAVTRNQSVTISGVNFPPNQTFTVRMGPYGGYGVSGAVSSTQINTGNGAFTAQVAIPAAVNNMSRIAMRLDNGSIYFSYNWFWNNTTNPPSTVPERTGTNAPKIPPTTVRTINPTIGIEKIEGETVTFRTYDFPANQVFNVYMGSRASGGYSDYIGTFNSGNGSNQDVMITIPARIAHYGYMWLRLDSGQYSPYVGFDNPADVPLARGAGVAGAVPVRAANAPVWHGTPTITMCAVTAGNNVTFVGNNLTTNLDYTVRMNAFGTMGYNGYVVGTVSPGSNPSVRATFNLPPQLAAHQRVAVRLDAPGGYNAYNWFWNNTATVC